MSNHNASGKKSSNSKRYSKLISAKELITDPALIGTENYPKGPEEPEIPIYWPGIKTSHITVKNQPGTVTDVAVAFSLKGNASQDASGIFATLVSPSGVRIPIAGTTLDPEFLSYRNPLNAKGAYTAKTFDINAGKTKGFIFSESKERTSNYNIKTNIKNKLHQGRTNQALASLNPLKGSQANGTWELEVRNSSDTPIKLKDWQLFLKSKDEVQKKVASSADITPSSLHPKTTLNQAVTALEADTARVEYGVNGKGVKIGLISNTFNSLGGAAWDYKTGVLDEKKIKVLLNQDIAETSTGPDPAGAEDEGRAMAQNLHSIAPGAEILYHSWNDETFNNLILDAADPANSREEQDNLIREAFQVYAVQQDKFRDILIALAEDGARIIVDDLDDSEPWFEDGKMAQAISYVKEKYGVAYFAASGNSLNDSYMSKFQARNREAIDQTTFSQLPIELQQELNAGHELHLFEGSNGASTFMQRITNKVLPAMALQWNSKWGENTKKLKVMVFDEDGNYVSDGLQDPDNKYPWTGFTSASTTFSIAVVHDGVSAETRPDVFKWIQGQSMDTTVAADSDIGFYQGTAMGHANGPASANVQSNMYWGTPAYRAESPTLGRFGSWGVTPIYFDSEGNFLADPELRETPAFIAPQKGDTTFFSNGYQDKLDADRDYLQNFEGTSAAAPNAAAVAALMLQLDPTLTPDEIYNGLKKTATQLKQYNTSTTNSDGFNNATGFGLINAKAVLKEIAKRKPSVEVFLDGNGNGRVDQTNGWQEFTTGGSRRKPGKNRNTNKSGMMRDRLTGLSNDADYGDAIEGSLNIGSRTALGNNNLLVSTITSTSDYDVITKRRKDLTLDGDLLLKFDGTSSSTTGSYSILQAKSLQGSFDTIRVEGLDSNLYIGVGIKDGNTFHVTVADTFFDGSMQAGSLF